VVSVTNAEITVEPTGIYVNGRWVIDTDYRRIDVHDEAEAIYYSALWNTPYHNEGDHTERLWWVELPDDLKRRIALLAQTLLPAWGLVFN
jgi:hypothetical protein